MYFRRKHGCLWLSFKKIDSGSYLSNQQRGRGKCIPGYSLSICSLMGRNGFLEEAALSCTADDISLFLTSFVYITVDGKGSIPDFKRDGKPA